MPGVRFLREEVVLNVVFDLAGVVVTYDQAALIAEVFADPARQPRLWQDITRLTPADVDAWLQTAQRKGLAPSTLHSLLSVVRRFCTFLQEQGLLAHHPS